MTLEYDSITVIIIIEMNTQQQTFTLDELATLVDLPRRTVRYYIQIALVDRPEGLGRGSHYTANHLEQLMEIQRWRRVGLSLERIRELLTAEEKEMPMPLKPHRSGAIEMRNHVAIGSGVELVIDPNRSGLTSERVRELVDGVLDVYEKISKE